MTIHLLPRLLERHSLATDQVELDEEALDLRVRGPVEAREEGLRWVQARPCLYRALRRGQTGTWPVRMSTALIAEVLAAQPGPSPRPVRFA